MSIWLLVGNKVLAWFINVICIFKTMLGGRLTVREKATSVTRNFSYYDEVWLS